MDRELHTYPSDVTAVCVKELDIIGVVVRSASAVGTGGLWRSASGDLGDGVGGHEVYERQARYEEHLGKEHPCSKLCWAVRGVDVGRREGRRTVVR